MPKLPKEGECKDTELIEIFGIPPSTIYEWKHNNKNGWREKVYKHLKKTAKKQKLKENERYAIVRVIRIE